MRGDGRCHPMNYASLLIAFYAVGEAKQKLQHTSFLAHLI